MSAACTAKFPSSPQRRALLAQVHIAKKELGLSDADYRAVIYTKFDKDSAAHLSNAQLRALVSAFKEKGWKGGRRQRKPNVKARSNGYRSPSKRGSIRKIYVLWGILHKAGIAKQKRPDGYVRRMTKSELKPDGVGNTEWLDEGEAYVIIEGLKSWIIREGLAHQLEY